MNFSDPLSAIRWPRGIAQCLAGVCILHHVECGLVHTSNTRSYRAPRTAGGSCPVPGTLVTSEYRPAEIVEWPKTELC